MIFDEGNGTRNQPEGNSLYNVIQRRRTPLMINRDNSGFTPTYAVKAYGPHMGFIVIGLVLFAWLYISHDKD